MGDLEHELDAGWVLCLKRPEEILPADVDVMTLADRGFDGTKPFGLLGKLGLDDVIGPGSTRTSQRRRGG